MPKILHKKYSDPLLALVSNVEVKEYERTKRSKASMNRDDSRLL